MKRVYGTIIAHSNSALDKEVTELLGKGWECQGGVTAFVEGDWQTWAQAMTREVPVVDEEREYDNVVNPQPRP